MRRLATFCFAFAAGVFAAQYLLPQRLLPYAAAGCVVLGALWAWTLRGDNRRRAAIAGLGLALALCWDWAYVRLTLEPFETLAGTTQTLTVELADYPTASEYGSRAEVRVIGDGLHGKAICYGGTELLELAPGARLSAPFEIRSAATIRGADVTTHISRGVYALLYVRGEVTREAGNENSPRCLPQKLARRTRETVAAVFPERTRAMMNAILLGDRYELSDEDETYLSEAGLLHITAVSGLHCAFLLSILIFLIGRHRSRLLFALALPVLWLYALTTGLTPSVTRACVMLSLMLLAPVFERESDPPTSLALALFLLLLANPFAAKSISLQLSFAAMAGLITLTPRLYARIRAKKRGRAAWFVLGSLAATAGALVFTIPLSAFYFNTLVLAAPLSNLLCLWAATLTFAAGVLTVLVGFVWLSAARVLACVPHGGALYLLSMARGVTKIPYHAVYFSGYLLKCWLVYAYALFAACRLMKEAKRRYWAAALLCAATLILTLWVNALPLRGGSLHIVALDVGQGQSVVLHSRGATALLDCGTKSYLSAGDVTADYLQSVGVGTLDCVVLSHYHADHCNGLAVLFSRLHVRRLILPDIEPDDELRAEVLELAQRHGVPVSFARETEMIPLGEATLTVYPPAAEGDMNEECLAALCTTGRFDALFTADMDANTEYMLLAKNALPDVEVLMAGHHGSKYSSGGDLLVEVRPEVAVVSCGASNSYGHPHAEALHRLTDAGATVYRTDLQGNIHITVN